MPTYDYVCQKCGHAFEHFQSMNDPKLTDCPLDGCDGTVKRLLGTGAGIIFKGGGFYETDYRSDSYKSGQKKESDAAAPKESKESKDSGSKDSGSKDSKPEGGKRAESKSSEPGKSSGSSGTAGSAPKKAD